ncbi:MAG: histidine kinase [Bacteroidetes bacterium]|nr:MAG: histidine kinase [Bacteroidota bacterium]
MFLFIKQALGSSKEVLFQLVLHLLVFVFYSFDKHHPSIEAHQVMFFLNYAAGAFVINYLLLPKFFYKKKYLYFFAWTLLVVAAVILVEEMVIEKIYFPDTRGRHFPGLFFSLLDVLPVIVILSGFKFAWDALGKQREVEALQAAVKESELQFLKSQINPHFLFNNLNNLYAYSIENSPKTPTIILELSAVLRYMLYECRAEYVPLNKEIEQLKHFTRLNQLQIEERGSVTFHKHNIQSGYQIAPLILIVFIENAFKHSQSSQVGNIHIHIEVELKEDGWLVFRCRNNYQPLTNTEKLTQGIGLENVKKRLQLLYPQAHRLKIRQSETEYEVELQLQLSRNAQKASR